MYLLKRYQIGVGAMLICILSCSTNLFAQSKQAIQQYETGLMALERNESKLRMKSEVNLIQYGNNDVAILTIQNIEPTN